MRRLQASVVVAVLLTLAVASSATVSADYRDEFESGTWSGSDGSLPVSTSWARQGSVTLVSGASCNAGSCMRMGALTTLLQTLRATRGADTGMFDGDFNLRFRLKAGSSLGGSVKVMVRADGGGWDTVKTYSLGSSINDHPTIALDESFRSETFEVRFEYAAVLLGTPAFIDDVEIQGAIAEETTTTSTTTTVHQTTTTSPTTTSTTRAPSSTTSTTQPSDTTITTSGSTEGTAGPITSTTSTTSTTLSTSSSTTTTTLAIGPGGPGGPGGSGPTLPPTSTSTTISTAEAIGGPGSGDSGTVPDTTGIRASARGLQADFQGDLYGDVRTVSSLNGVDVQADYNMAVEVIESSWAWMVLLGLLVAYSIITGLDRRRGIDA